MPDIHTSLTYMTFSLKWRWHEIWALPWIKKTSPTEFLLAVYAPFLLLTLLLDALWRWQKTRRMQIWLILYCKIVTHFRFLLYISIISCLLQHARTDELRQNQIPVIKCKNVPRLPIGIMMYAGRCIWALMTLSFPCFWTPLKVSRRQLLTAWPQCSTSVSSLPWISLLCMQ
jgi:hypothetical protein